MEIGRALAVRPKLLLLDEPAAGMNPGEVEQLMDLVRWIREQFHLTIWLIEHQMRVVMGLCEWIKVLDFGETIAKGSPSEVRGNRRAGGHNSLTRTRLKPLFLIGGYAQFTYAFNYWGPPGVNRDTFVVIKKLDKLVW